MAAPLLSKIQSMLPTPKKAGQSVVAGTGPTRPHPPARTGDITTGPKVQAASQSIDSSGGTIAITKPGDPMDGFVINVPPKSYADGHTFKVSSAPITKQTFGSDINPVSPMITVDNGGGYSDELMYVRVPVKVPKDSFAMGFLYDEKTKQLEGMPLVGSDAESVTVATSHFSNFFVSMIKKALLKKDIDSGFRPGIDDWQFFNNGSAIAPKGHCEGQSLTAMWYYCTQPDGKDMCLYGRYDNNGNQPATPTLDQDDSLGYRFCSVIQEEQRFGADIVIGNGTLAGFWDNLGGKCWDKVNEKWVDCPGILGDEAELNLFTYSIQATHEPQEVVMLSNAGGGHAMVVYKIVGNALYVADPNYRGATDRKIIYYSGDGKFKPYQSGANREEIDNGNSKAYEKILYAGKSTILPWDKIAQHWAELKAGTIGNGIFPGYVLIEGQKPLIDGYSTSEKFLYVAAVGRNEQGVIDASAWNCNQYRDGIKLPDGDIELKPGDNLLGFDVMTKVGNDWEYVDFKYINVVFQEKEQAGSLPYTTMNVNLQIQDPIDQLKITKKYVGIPIAGGQDIPITCQGLSFSGNIKYPPPMLSQGSGTTVEVNGALSKALKRDELGTMNLTVKCNRDITLNDFHEVISTTYTLTGLPIGTFGIGSYQGEHYIGVPLFDGADIQKYLTQYQVVVNRQYIGPPKDRYSPDESWTYNSTTCVDSKEATATTKRVMGTTLYLTMFPPKK